MGETVKESSLLRALRWVGRALLRLPRPAGVLLFLLWTRVIWHLSSIPSKDSGGGFVKGWLVNSAHAPLFGFLAFLALVSLPRDDAQAQKETSEQSFSPGPSQGPWPQITWTFSALILGAVLAYGLIDEWHQSHVPSRDASGWDILTDCTGAACTLWIAAYLGRSEASSRGLTLRVVAGLGLCLLAGLKAAV